MSECKQLRPRLTTREIRFLIDSLKQMLVVATEREREYKELKRKVYRLRQELRYNTLVWKELKQAKEELSNMGNVESTVFHCKNVCNAMIRRFESLLNGGHLHLDWSGRRGLEVFYLEPKKR